MGGREGRGNSGVGLTRRDLRDGLSPAHRETRVLRARAHEPLSREHRRLDQRREALRAPGRYLIRGPPDSRTVLLRLVRCLIDAGPNSEPQQQRLHVDCEPARNRLEEDSSLSDTAVAAPERGEEASNLLLIQLEDVLGNPLLVAAGALSMAAAGACVAAGP